MARRTTTPVLVIYLIYLAALAMTTALLAFWILVVQRFNIEINQLVSRLGVEWNQFHWFVGSAGGGLFFLVIVALTYLLALTLAERRYSRKQEEFLANITHELKTPVAAIKLHAQTLEQEEVSAAEQRRFVGYIVQEAERVAGLVDNLLESGRLIAGKSTGDLVPIDLRQFFRQYQQAVEARFDLGGIDLRFEVRSRSVVMATHEALSRVMDNLISNALRFTAAGDRILCQVHDGARDAEIVVADTGVGIPRRDLHKIFDRFYRLRREIGQRRSAGRGTGLGLAIVRGLVEEMRGHIRAVSSDDRPGTRFEIRLPQVDLEEPAREAHEPAQS